MRVFFRVDSSSEIGSGHLIRSLFLAKSLKEKGLDCTFISRDLNGNFNNLISDMGFKLIPLKKPKIIENINPVKSKSNYESWIKISFSEDAKEVINILQKKEIDLLIVDHYALDIKWEKILKKYVKKILVIDDLVNRNHFCDILIDPTYDRKPIDYQSLTNKNCIVFSGSDYAIINSKFSDQREKSIKRLFNKNKIKILVSLGGIDKYELSHKIIKILSKENFFLITVLINPISKNYISVKELCVNMII